MDDVRRGQIALLLVKHKFREEGIRFTPDLRCKVEDTAKAISISAGEAMEFVEYIVRELVEETFPKPACGE